MANERRKLGSGYKGKPTPKQRTMWFYEDRAEREHEEAVTTFLEQTKSGVSTADDGFRRLLNETLRRNGHRPIGRELPQGDCPFIPTERTNP